MKGEVYRPSFQALGALLDQTDRDHTGRNTKEAYQAHRLEFALNAVAGISKNSNIPFQFTAPVLGFKCPRIELDMPVIDKITAGSDLPVTFFFCTRKISDNYLSVKSNYGLTPENYITTSSKSLKAATKLMARDDVDFRPLSLEEFSTAEDKGLWVQKNLFAALPEAEVSRSRCDAITQAVTKVNSSHSLGKKRLLTLTSKERMTFENHTDFRDLVLRVEKKMRVRMWDF